MADGNSETGGFPFWGGMPDVTRPLISPREAWARWAAGLSFSNPLFDSAALTLLGRAFFPVSRMWAAAQLAGRDPVRFAELVPIADRLEQRDLISRALTQAAAARVTAEAVDARWREAFFGPASAETTDELVAIEAARLHQRHVYNSTRAGFARLVGRNAPRVHNEIVTPHAARAAFPADTIEQLFAPPQSMPAVRVSRAIPTSAGRESWIEFQSPSRATGDVVTARVHEPPDAKDPPTLIYGHGICVEFDHWQGLVDETPALVARGFRVIRPEAPWHGRRAPKGRFGGEHIVGRFPLGILEALTAAVCEWSVLADWARATSAGPLAFGGVSLGALTSQLAASRARDWPERLRPDALYLVTHCARVSDALMGEAIHSLFGGLDIARPAGWTPELARDMLAPLDPSDRAPLPSERIISVLGRRDIVTPYDSGRELVERWCLPTRNVFVLDRGHFSVPMTLVRHTDPVDRFRDVVMGNATPA